MFLHEQKNTDIWSAPQDVASDGFSQEQLRFLTIPL